MRSCKTSTDERSFSCSQMKTLVALRMRWCEVQHHVVGAIAVEMVHDDVSELNNVMAIETRVRSKPVSREEHFAIFRHKVLS